MNIIEFMGLGCQILRCNVWYENYSIDVKDFLGRK